MIRIVSITMALLLLATSVTGAASQERRCLPPEHTVETFKQHLVDLGRADRRSAISGLVGAALEPPAPPACRVRLPEEENLQEVMEDLIYFVADQDVPGLTGGFFQAIGRMLRVDVEGREQRTLPMDAMACAVEQGRTAPGRGHAFWTLRGLVEYPEVERYLLRWARAPRGPPAWRDLPRAIVTRLYFTRFEQEDALREALESAPSLVRNAGARCLVENRGARVGPGVAPEERCPWG